MITFGLPDPHSGEMVFRTPAGNIALGPGTTKGQFLADWTNPAPSQSETAGPPWFVYTLKGDIAIEAIAAILTVAFEGERLDSCTIYLAIRKSHSWGDWSEAEERHVKTIQDKLVATAYRRSAPVKFSWGVVWSLFQPQSGTSEMGVSYASANAGT